MKLTLSVDFHFSAAHQLPHYDGPCRRMHGHNYRLQVVLTGRIDPTSGMIRDFGDIKRQVHEAALSRCDHHCLNDVHPNPTAENMAAWFWTQLRPVVEGLTAVRLWETPESCVTVTAE